MHRLFCHITCAVLLSMTLSTRAAETTPAADRPVTGGIFVLDDRDSEWEGKDSYEDRLTLFTSAGKTTFSVSGINQCQTVGSNHLVAYDAQRRCVWVSEIVGNCTKRYDLNGRVTLNIPLEQAGAIALHPETGQLWALASDKTIYGTKIVVFDEHGQEIMTHEMGGFDIVYDRTENAFWTVNKNVTKIFAADGQVDFSQRVAEWCAVSIDMDPQSGAAWIGVRKHPDVPESKNQLVKCSRHGRQLATVELGQAGPFCVSVDPKTSDVWVANINKSVERYSSEGRHQASFPIPALAIRAVCGGDSSCAWLVTKTHLQKLNAQGESLLKIELGGKTGQAWLAAME